MSQEQLSSTCHVSFLAAPDTDHKHKFSLAHFIHLPYLSDGLTFTSKPYDSRPIFTLRCSTAEWRFNTKSHLSQVMSPSRLSSKTSTPKRSSFEVLEPRRIELDRNLGTDPYQIHERLVRSSLTEDMDEFGKVGADGSYFQSQMHSDYDFSGEHCRLGP